MAVGRARMTPAMRANTALTYHMILSDAAVARARQERAQSRAKSREVFHNSMERRRRDAGTVEVRARPAPDTTFVASDKQEALIERIEQREPHVRTLWRGLERALRPEADSSVLRDWLQLGCMWGLLPTADELGGDA